MDVIFDEEPPIERHLIHKAKKESLFTKLMIAMKLAKTPDEAQSVLLMLALAIIVFSIGLLFFALNPPRKSIPQSTMDAELARLQTEQN